MLGQAVDGPIVQGATEPAPTYYMEAHVDWFYPPCRSMRPLNLVHGLRHSVDTVTTVLQRLNVACFC
jgi:hypothetical protein